ncbi:Hypothetical predicted protein [Paramuricea clavata]|uniref:Uncharacterized protein n=1 Tax=Paramuricea clavata TaxID=317549 RepID=A0A6S7JIV6_PARCT|nr:Hypothetical predicted protein [Paramuricea clavata]
MLNDVKKLSPEVQTSHLEAFHSTLNQFHPKMTAYSYTGTYCRHALAIVHFNENIKRDAKKTKDGKVYYSIHYPKYKNGDELVRTVPVPPSYNYVKDLRNMLFKDTKASMKLKILEFLKNVPAPLSSQFSNKVDRLTALDNYHKRQEMTVQLYPSLSEQDQLQLTASGPEPTNTPKTRCCTKCKKPMKGHKRGQC